jgi:hypothetical protein
MQAERTKDGSVNRLSLSTSVFVGERTRAGGRILLFCSSHSSDADEERSGGWGGEAVER